MRRWKLLLPRRAAPQRGQALVEFSLTILVFLGLLMAVVDLGRGIYMYNGVAESARELARVTAVHQGTAFGNSSETAGVLNAQKKLIPNLQNPTYACVDMTDTAVALDDDGLCPVNAGNRVKVTITAPYQPLTPLISLSGTWTMSSTSSTEIP
jgi:Flp pilus assembly protein TadG